MKPFVIGVFFGMLLTISVSGLAQQDFGAFRNSDPFGAGLGQDQIFLEQQQNWQTYQAWDEYAESEVPCP